MCNASAHFAAINMLIPLKKKEEERKKYNDSYQMSVNPADWVLTSSSKFLPQFIWEAVQELSFNRQKRRI